MIAYGMRCPKVDVCQKLSVANTTLRSTEHESVKFFDFFFCISLYNNIIFYVKNDLRLLYRKNQPQIYLFMGEINGINVEKIHFKEQ